MSELPKPTLGTLAKIREQFRVKLDQSLKCPLCGHGLTVEKTEFFESQVCENCFEHVKITDVEECCASPDFHRVKFVIAGGGIQAREQCKSCGFVKSNPIGGLSLDDRQALPSLDEELRTGKYDRKYELKRSVGQRVANMRSASSRTNWLKKYSDYLHSPEWRAKRELVLKRDSYVCQACLNALATQVHHKSYEFVDLAGNEPSFDLVSVCTPCHEKIETMKKERRNS